MSTSSLLLGVNIDHVATLRQARYPGGLELPNSEPDVIAAAAICEGAGATGITVHLRGDRRHIQDRDIYRLRETLTTKMNFEMGNAEEIIGIALKVKPEDVCLVPEKREEVTTEGGLDVAAQQEALKPTIARLHEAGSRISLFIEPDLRQIEASAALGVEMVELHTGAFANAQGEAQQRELERLRIGAEAAHQLGLQVNAGHGINYTNIALVRTLPHLVELNIGHSIISRSVFVGLERAVKEMLAAMRG